MSSCYNLEERIAFVHIPKCAGSSIGGTWRDNTWSNCWLNDVIGGFTMDKFPIGHIPVAALEQFTGKPIDWWNKIIVTIRNPFEQQLSQWAFWRKRGAHCKATGRNVHNDDLVAMSTTLEQFVKSPFSAGPNAMCGDKWQEVGGVFRWWIGDLDGTVAPNVHVIRTEDLHDRIYDVLGIDDSIPVPHRNTSSHGEWQNEYTPEAIEAVRSKFAWSFAMYYQDVIKSSEPPVFS